MKSHKLAHNIEQFLLVIKSVELNHFHLCTQKRTANYYDAPQKLHQYDKSIHFHKLIGNPLKINDHQIG